MVQYAPVEGDLETLIGELQRYQLDNDDSWGVKDEKFTWFRRLMLKTFKINSKERMVTKEVVRYLLSGWP